MVVGTLAVDVLLGDVHSLKQKRAVVRPIVAELRRRFEVAAAETGQQNLSRRVRTLRGRPAGDRVAVGSPAGARR
jgi:uncharacterized protein YlxP (DUF503 family)